MKIEISNGRLIDPASRRRSRRRRFTSPRQSSRRDRRGAARLARQPGDRRRRASIVCRRVSIDISRACASPASNTRRRSESEMQAAIAGGVTSLACPPDTDPPLDEPGLVEMLKHRARSLNLAHVYPIGALTVGLPGRRRSPRWASSPTPAASRFRMPTRRSPTRRCCCAGDAVRGDVRLSRLAAAAGRASVAGAASRTTAKSRRVCGLPAIPPCAETIALGDDLRAGARHRRARASGAAVDAGRRRRRTRGQDAKACRDLRRWRINHLHLCDVGHRLVRRALPPGPALARRRATAQRCAAGLPTAPSISSAPITRRSTTTASSCLSPKPSRARPDLELCCR